MRIRRATFGVLVALQSILIAGCPVPLLPGDTSGSRQNIDDKIPDFIIEGKTTRADVLLTLGEPDAASEHGSQFAYGRTTSDGGVFFLMAAGGGAGGLGFEGMTYRRLVILFDENNVVTTASVENASCTKKDLVMGAGIDSAPCLNIAGFDLLMVDPAGVRTVDADTSGQIFSRASWYQGTRGFDRIRTFRQHTQETPSTGILIVGNASIQFFSSDADSTSRPMLALAYRDIDDLYVDTFGFGRRLVVKRLTGDFDSFEIVDSKTTTKAGELAKSHWQSRK